jgi:hypothetical protein
MVYTGCVRNLTVSADERLIEEARRIAESRHTTLNSEFRDWLVEYTGRAGRMEKYRELMSSLGNFRMDRKYTRDEMNER